MNPKTEDHGKSTDSKKITWKKSLLFVFCAVPGLAVFIFSFAVIPFLVFLYSYSGVNWLLSLCIPGMLIGWFMMLVGIGKMKSWGSFKRNLVKGILFIICAIPGVFVFIVSLAFFIFKIFDRSEVITKWWPILSIGGVGIGWILILIGTGRVKKWLYGLVFLSMPFIILIIGILFVFYKADTTDIPGFFFFFGLGFSMYLVERAVTRYYRKKDEKAKTMNHDAKTGGQVQPQGKL